MLLLHTSPGKVWAQAVRLLVVSGMLPINPVESCET